MLGVTGMKIENDNFKIFFNKDEDVVYFSGSLRMNDLKEFTKIKQYLLDVYELDTPQLTLNFHDLTFMNSAGISTLCKFIFEVKELDRKSIKVLGNSEIIWQKKTFRNLQTIWSSMVIEFY